MFTTRHAWRSAALCAFACALAVAALAATASAHPVAPEHYFGSYGDPVPLSPALAQERYYRSYGAADVVTARDTATQGDAWLVVALSAGGALVLAAAGFAGRQWTHRRRRVVPA